MWVEGSGFGFVTDYVDEHEDEVGNPLRGSRECCEDVEKIDALQKSLDEGWMS